MSHYRVAGLSRFLKLGECVSVDVGGRVQIGEVVKIDDASATLKPFDARCDAAIGARAYRTENLSLSPDPSWKGRVIDALGRPLDGGGDLAYGEQPAPLDAEPPPALQPRARHDARSRPASASSICSRRCASASASACSPARASANRRCWRCSPARRSSTPSSSRWSASAAAKCANSSTTRSATTARQRRRRRLDRRRKPDDAAARAEDGDDGRRIFSRSGRIGAADRRFGDALRPCRARRGAGRGRAGGRARLCAERVQRSAAPARARRAGRRRARARSPAIFSVLVDGDDHNDPVADAIRGTLDGHIVLDRAIADQGRYPAVNILSSVSRLAHPVWTPEQRKLVSSLRVARSRATRRRANCG